MTDRIVPPGAVSLIKMTAKKKKSMKESLRHQKCITLTYNSSWVRNILTVKHNKTYFKSKKATDSSKIYFFSTFVTSLVFIHNRINLIAN